MTMKRLAMAAAALATGLAVAGSASAALERRYSYFAENDEAKHRTQDVHLLISQSLLGHVKVLHIYRSRGDGFDVRAVAPPWSVPKLKVALEGDPKGVGFYAVDPKEGEGFTRGACHGAARAWLAMAPPQPYQPLVIAVIGDNAGDHTPVICERLEYRWQGEWVLPTQRNDSPKIEDGPTKKF